MIDQNSPQPSEQMQGHLAYAGFGERFLAALIDGVIMGIAIGVILAPLSMAVGQDNVAGVQIGGNAFSIILSYLYYALFYQYKGATLGQSLMKIRVVNKDSQSALNWGETALREVLGKALSSIPVYLGYFWYFSSPTRQAWHDSIANSLVVKVDEDGNLKYTNEPVVTKPFLTWLFPAGCCLGVVLLVVIMGAAMASFFASLGGSNLPTTDQLREINSIQKDLNTTIENLNDVNVDIKLNGENVIDNLDELKQQLELNGQELQNLGTDAVDQLNELGNDVDDAVDNVNDAIDGIR